MDADIMVEALPILGACNLCLNDGAVKSMLVPHINMGKSEIYSEMLLNCFAIDISQTELDDTKRLICIPCIVKLRECETFRTMVQQSLNTLRENAKLLKEEKVANIKEEFGDIGFEDNNFDDIIHKDDDFDENEEEVNIKEEVCDIDIEDNDLDDIIHKDDDFDENEEEKEANIKEEVCDIDIEDNDLDDIIRKGDDFDENAEVRNIREEVGDIDNEDNDLDDIIHKDDDFDENAQIETTPCKVCGDEPTGLHFGVITCLACRAFFIRSLSRVEKYHCSRENACVVDRVYRNRCQYCRLQKCIKLGMSRAGE